MNYEMLRKTSKCRICSKTIPSRKHYCNDCKFALNIYRQIAQRDSSFEEWGRDNFVKWYGEQKECRYCHITKDENEQFYKYVKMRSRCHPFGKNFLIGRKNNNNSYTPGNCVAICCYCARAKSHVFDEGQFKDIGIAIGKAIKDALKRCDF